MLGRFFSLSPNRRWCLVAPLLVFMLVSILGELLVNSLQRETRLREHSEAVAHASTLRARIERELNTMLYMNSGLSSYLIVRHDSLQADEINEILAVLHRSSRFVRNFGVAIGHRLTYVYPVLGNESAIGLNYKDLPEQWPLIEAIINSGVPSLAGPLRLIQGGNGLIYRVPLFVDGQYWGLLSTVMDLDRMNHTLFGDEATYGFEIAIRSQPLHEVAYLPVFGDAALFDQPTLVVQSIDVPGGEWLVAVKPRDASHATNLTLLLRTAVVLLALLTAWLLRALMMHRLEMTAMAMYDGLTGLPNRRMLEDRHLQVVARMKRKPEQINAILFLDLDGFKPINDEYGHKAGDMVLKVLAERFRAMVRSNDLVVRWGGDEFIVLLEDINDDCLDTTIARFRAIIEAPITLGGSILHVGCSIGVSVYPYGNISLDEMLKHADQQMFADKSTRKTR